jgi:hypothetical protein
MKKLSVIVACVVLAGVAAMAATPPVYSVNAVGYVKVAIPGTNTSLGLLSMVAVPFVTVGTGKNADSATLDEMIGVNGFVPSGSLLNSDQIMLWTGATYARAFLCDSSWAVEGFPEVANKWCYMANDENYGGDRPYLCSATNIFNLWTGRGFWVRNRHANTTLTMAGEVPTLGTNDVEIGSSLTMVAYPYPVEKPIATILSTADGAYASGSQLTADQIMVWDGAAYVRYFLCDSSWGVEGFPETAGKWCYMANDDNYGGDRPYVATAMMKPGDGFWYRSRGGAFTWPVTKPYGIGD